MIRRFGLVPALVLALSFTVPNLATADSGSATFKFLAGSGFLCGIEPSACPDVARAANGDAVALTGAGALSIHSKSATGSGTFVHRKADGTVLATGTWTAQTLLSFNDYGPSTDPAFAGLRAGNALIVVTLFVGGTPVHDAILEVTCRLPGDQGPAEMGKGEGIRLAVQGALNFNEKVSGFTIYIPVP
jgi:hypothetical protein